MIKAQLSDIAKLLGINAPTHDISFHGISHDTRTLIPGNLYVAILGEQYDGHDFVTEAEKKGASAVLVSKPMQCSIPQLIVDNTILALGKIAEQWRDRFDLTLIGVTGSNGKTTLKNMIASILRAACHNHPEQVFATEGNFNNDIGLPLNLVRLNEQHRYAVIEMGMNHFGEIEYLTQLAKPAIAVINNAAESHLAGLKDIAGVAKAKGEIFIGLSANGTAILNRDDAFFNYWRELIGDNAYLTFGLNAAADVSTTTVIANQPIQIKTPQGSIEVNLPLLGLHNVKNALAATATALAVGVDLSAIKTGLEQMQPAYRRMQQYTLASGALVIDDCYNANPFSTKAAIDTLATYPNTRMLVLADMRELGSNEIQMHTDIGDYARAAGIQYLFTFGTLTEATSKSFGEHAQHFSDKEKLAAALKPFLNKNDVTVLVKGSRSMKMEHVIQAIIPHEQLDHAH